MPRVVRHVRLSLLAAVLCGPLPAHATVPLLQTVPLVQSSVYAQTWRSGDVRLADPPSSFYVYDDADYRSAQSSHEGIAARLGGANAATVLTQWDGTATAMSASASTLFGINHVSVSMDANVAPDYYRSFGSIAPSASFIDDYIYGFDYGNFDSWYDPNEDRYVYAQSGLATHYASVAPSSTFIDHYVNGFDYGNAAYVYDDNNSRHVYVSNAHAYDFDPNTNDLVFFDAGSVAPDPNGTPDYYFVPNAEQLVFDTPGVIAPSPWGGGNEAYFVPNQPEVEIDMTAQRSVQAYSRWEDVFYFARPQGATAAGDVARLLVLLEGSVESTDWAGYFSFTARDWEHKDSFGDYLGYIQVAADGSSHVMSQLVEIDVPFVYGQPQYIKAEAQAYLYGEGAIDFGNTVRLVSIGVPAGAAVYSYASYLFGTPLGYSVLGGVDGGSLPGGYEGFFGGGAGGGVVVPLPAPLAGFAFGLGALLAVGRGRAASAA